MLTERAPAFTFEPGGPHGALARGDSGGAGAGGCAESEDRLRMRGDSASATGTNCTCGAEDEARLRMRGDGGGGSAAGCGTTGGRKHKRCVQAKEDRPQMRGSDEGPPEFSSDFFDQKLELDVSAHGLDADQLPISIEKVCRVPKRLAKEAAQLAGGDGVALITDTTKVFQAGGSGQAKKPERLEGEEALRAIDGADTGSIKARPLGPDQWAEDEDGSPVPTFTALKVKVTD
jgi:hypothetical protein